MNMEIEIYQIGQKYVGEFTVTEDFNLHVEKLKEGNMYVYQRTTDSGDYVPQQEVRNIFWNKIIDIDMQGVIYPKYIRIVSDAPIIKCVITYNS